MEPYGAPWLHAGDFVLASYVHPKRWSRLQMVAMRILPPRTLLEEQVVRRLRASVGRGDTHEDGVVPHQLHERAACIHARRGNDAACHASDRSRLTDDFKCELGRAPAVD